jgi:hypothetical protein
VATFSAVSGMLSTPYISFMRLFTKRQPMVVSYTALVREKAVSALGMTKGARLMLSTPPAIISCASPDLMARAAVPTASRPEPHKRLMVAPGRSMGRPASRVAMRATLRLSSPAWLAQPKITSVTWVQSTPGLRAISAFRGMAPRSSARTLERAPP